jgi:hypothetical protein
MPGKQTQRGDASRAYSLGFELVCAVAGFVLVGVWIDRHYNSGPWGTLICLFLGLIGGFYNLFRESSRLFGGRGAVPAGASSAAGGLRAESVSPRGKPTASPAAEPAPPDQGAGGGRESAASGSARGEDR